MNPVVYLVRHGEIEHHRTDISLTPRGRTQARDAGAALAKEIRAGDTVYVRHSPVIRVVETAVLLCEELAAALARAGRGADQVILAPQPDEALHNVRFRIAADRELQEPSLLYAEMNTPAYKASIPAARAEFFSGFWGGADPMGYWLTHDSDGGAETPPEVLARLKTRLREIFSAAPARARPGDADASSRAVYIMVTHSGAMRVLLRDILGADPGEPDFCGIITFEASAKPAQLKVTYRGQTAQLTYN